MTIQKVVQRTLFIVGVLALAVWACVVVGERYSTAVAGTLPASSGMSRAAVQSDPDNLADRLRLERIMVIPR